MGNTIYTKTLNQVIVVAKTISGIGNDRAFQGYHRFKDSENFEDMITRLTPYTQGYFLADLGPCTREYLGTPGFTVKGSLYISAPKDDSSTLDAAYDFADSLANALSLPSNFIEADSALALPKRVRWAPYQMDSHKSKGVFIFDFGHYGAGEISFIDP